MTLLDGLPLLEYVKRFTPVPLLLLKLTLREEVDGGDVVGGLIDEGRVPETVGCDDEGLGWSVAGTVGVAGVDDVGEDVVDGKDEEVVGDKGGLEDDDEEVEEVEEEGRG